MLPNARTRNGVGQTVKDLSEDPYAGADVTLTLTAKDEAGNEGKSEPFNMRLPERLFTKPLARALIEQRRILALDANKNRGGLHRARRADDRAGIVHAGRDRAISRPLQRGAAARGRPHRRCLREVVASLWALAVTIEDGNITDVDKALRAAQDALKQALERGASDEEIKKLTQDLRAALDNFMRQLAEQMRNNPQQLARPLDPNTKMLRQQDLNNMIERMERLSRSGDKDAAKQLLDQLQQMLENLQMAQPGQSGDSDMEQALNELGDMIRKQQQLRDKTFKQGQDSRRDRTRGKQGDQEHGRPAAGPAGPARPAEEAAGRTRQARHDPGPARPEGPARRSRASRASRASKANRANRAIRATATDRPRRGRHRDGRCRRQARRRQCRRRGGFAGQGARRAAQGRAEPRRGDAAGRRRWPGRRPRRSLPAASRAAATRPIRWAGRCMAREFGDDLTVKIPGEIDVQRVRRILEELRRRLADPSRPQIELDYIERLLKDY